MGSARLDWLKRWNQREAIVAVPVGRRSMVEPDQLPASREAVHSAGGGERAAGVHGGLEAVADDELEGARAAGLEDGGEAAAGAAGTEHEVQHRSGLPEEGVHEEANGIGEVGLVEEVERFDA